MKFILVRHSTTDWNGKGRLQGQTDTELNEGGRQEAQELAQKLAGLGITEVISSDLKRAYQTAEIITDFLRVPLKAETGLRECAFGEVEGLTKEQAIAKYGPAIEKDWDDQFAGYDFHPFGGENQQDVLERHLKVLKRYANTSNGKNLLLVGHGRGLNTLLAFLKQEPNLKRGEYRIVDF